MLYFSSLIYFPNANFQYLDLINISRTIPNRGLISKSDHLASLFFFVMRKMPEF